MRQGVDRKRKKTNKQTKRRRKGKERCKKNPSGRRIDMDETVANNSLVLSRSRRRGALQHNTGRNLARPRSGVADLPPLLLLTECGRRLPHGCEGAVTATPGWTRPPPLPLPLPPLSLMRRSRCPRSKRCQINSYCPLCTCIPHAGNVPATSNPIQQSQAQIHSVITRSPENITAVAFSFIILVIIVHQISDRF